MAANRRALVTGGAKRIGAAICRSLHGAGFDIALHYGSSADHAHALRDELNGARADSCRSYRADLGDHDAVVGLAERVLGDGGLSLLVNNASLYLQTPLDQPLSRHWQALLATNLEAPLLLSEALRGALAQDRGSIVNLLDAHSARPQRGYAIYDMTRNAMASLTRSLALELAPQVRVNGVAPGAILPAEGDHPLSGDPAALVERIPLKSLGRVEDIAAAVRYLATEAPYVTGQVLVVDGGRSLAD
jgi:pteridine reductase